MERQEFCREKYSGLIASANSKPKYTKKSLLSNNVPKIHSKKITAAVHCQFLSKAALMPIVSRCNGSEREKKKKIYYFMTCSMCNVSTRPDVPRQELFVKFKFCSLFMLRQHDDSSDKHQNEKCKLLRSERDAAQTGFQERCLFAMEGTRYRRAQSLGRSAKKP